MNRRESAKFSRRQLITGTVGAAAVTALAAAPATAQTYGTKPLKGKKVLVAIGDFSESMETYYMVYRLVEEGIEPVVAAASVKHLQMVVHDFDPMYTNYTEKLGYFIQTNVAYQDVNPADYDALMIPGGRGPEEIRQYKEALDITRYFLDKKLPLGAMCHGPQLVYAARNMKGRRMAAFHGIRADVEAAGATFVDEPVVVDGNLVTSRGWPDLPDFMPVFLEVVARA